MMLRSAIAGLLLLLVGSAEAQTLLGISRAATGGGAPVLGPPGWVLVGDGTSATADIDCVNNRSWNNPNYGTAASPLTVSRTTTGGVGSYIDDTSGNWHLVPDNTLRQSNKGCLIEEARTNLVPWSSDLTQASFWNNAYHTAIGPTTPAPDGVGPAYKVVDGDTTNNQHAILSASTAAFSAGSTITYSAFLKPAEYTTANLLVASAGFASTFSATFSLTGAGSFSAVGGSGSASGVSASIQAYPNGWYRCSITGVIDSTSTSIGVAVYLNAGAAYVGVLGRGLYHWNSQVEAGAFPTSPIVTTGATVTRNADNITLSSIPTPTTYNPMAMAIYGQYSALAGVNVLGGWAAATGYSDVVYMIPSGSNISLDANVGGSGTVALTDGAFPSQFKIAATLATSSSNVSGNGSTATRVTGSPTNAAITAVVIGSAPWSPGGAVANSYITRFALIRNSVSDAGLVTLTTGP